MIFSMIHLSVQFTRCNPHTTHIVVAAIFKFDPVIFRSNSQISFLLGQFCDSQLKRNQFSLYDMTRTHAYVLLPPLIHNSRLRRVAFYLHAFRVLHNSFFVIPLLHALQHFIFPPPLLQL